MPHIGSKIKQLVEQKKFQISQLSVEVDKSNTAIYNDFKMEDLHTSVLKKYSKALGVPLSYWTKEENENNYFQEPSVPYGNQLLVKDLEYFRSRVIKLESENEALRKKIEDIENG